MAEPLRIGYVLKKYPRLSETFVVDEILALERSGVEIAIASLRLSDEPRFHAELARVRASVTYLPAFSGSSTTDALAACAALDIPPATLRQAVEFVERLETEKPHLLLVHGLLLADWARRELIDHLHAHFMTVAAHTAYLAHLLTGISFTVTAHAKDVYRHSVPSGVFAEIAAAASAVVTVCDGNRSYIEDELLGASGRVVRIYNGVFTDELRPAPVPARDADLVVGVGRLVEKKGFHVLLEALALVAADGVPFRCVIVGDGDEAQRLHELHARLGLGSTVELVGARSRDEVTELMARARMLVAPCVTGADGNRDALPTVLLESLALGVPTVTTPVGGIPEIVEHGREGLVVPEGDPAELAAAIARLLVDDDLHESCVRAAREKAEGRFDRRSNAQSLVDLFAGKETAPEPRLVEVESAVAG